MKLVRAVVALAGAGAAKLRAIAWKVMPRSSASPFIAIIRAASMRPSSASIARQAAGARGTASSRYSSTAS